MTNPPDLLVIGQATIDDIHREGLGAVSLQTPGGDSIYAVLGASVWPLNVGVVTCVGQDYPYAKLQQATCRPEGTDWNGLQRYEGPSIHDVAFYFADGRREYTFDDPTLLDTLSPGPGDVPPDMRLTSYVHLAPENISRQLELVQFFRERSAIVAVDVESHFFKGKESILAQLLKLDPIFIPSIEHIQELSGIDSSSPVDLWPWLANCGASLAIVKCGKKGAYIYKVREGEIWHIDVVSGVEVIDVTGAGDAFCGGFMAGLFLTDDVIEAAVHGTVSASFVVESLGAVCPEHFSPELAEERLNVLLSTTKREPVATGLNR